VAPDIVQRYILNADQYKAEIKDVAKEVRKQEKHERDLKKVMDAVTKSEKKTTKQTAKLTVETKKNTEAMKRQSKAAKSASKALDVMTVAAGNLVSRGISAIAGSMGEGIRVARDYEDWIGKDVAAIKGMRQASAGLISDLQLMKARTRLMNGDFALTEKQLQAVTKAAIHYTRVNKTEFSESLNKVTSAITRGTSRAMKDLGVNIDLVGKATVKTDDAIRLITERFGEMDIKALNTNERLDQTRNAFQNIVGSIGAAILSSDLFVSALTRISVSAKALMKGIELERGPGGKVRETGRVIGEEEKRLRGMKKRLDRLRAGRRPGAVSRIETAAEGAAHGIMRRLGLEGPQHAPIPQQRSALLRDMQISKARIAMLKRRQRSESAALAAADKARIEADKKARKDAERRRRRVAGLAGARGGRRTKKRKTGLDLLPDEFSPAGLPTFEDIFGKKEAAPVSAMNKMAKATEATSAAMSESQAIVGQLTQGFVNMGLSALQAGNNMSNAGNKASEALTSVLSMAGGAIGTAVGGPVGGAIGGTLGSALGGIFGSLFGSGRDLNRRKSSTVKRTTTAYQPGFGRAVESQRAIVLNVFVNDPANPSSQVITDAQLQRAANAA